jgi:ubiquinone/menaquinone biosynthesis C-methylase UbiE
MSAQSFARVKATFDQWAMYDAVVQANYMYHRESVAALSSWAKKQTQRLKIIDLGCGDAWLATHAFRDAKIASYLGVDVSTSAVERAQQHAAIWNNQVKVVAGNLADILHALPNDSANVILASFSIHHFATDAKIAIIADCHRVLSPGGTFIWIDAVRRNNETRENYLNRLTQKMQRDWTALTPDQRAVACTHVLESDFPEADRWMLEEMFEIGFSQTAIILQTEFFQGSIFNKT